MYVFEYNLKHVLAGSIISLQAEISDVGGSTPDAIIWTFCAIDHILVDPSWAMGGNKCAFTD